MVNIGSELEKYTYEYFLKEALSKAPKDIDSREGSVIYDALAPACYELAETMLHLKNVVLESFVQTASGQYLDLKAEEFGITRYPASNAIVKAQFIKQDGTPYEINVGDRFSSIGDKPVTYRVTEWLEIGEYLMICEIPGTKGNSYLGTLLPLSNYQDMMEATLIEITVPARNVETDDDLRERVLNAHSSIAFGGNVADYLRYVSEIDDISGAQIYPVWNGPGTVRVVILDNQYDAASDDLVDEVQEKLDPINHATLGRGMAPIGHKVTVAKPDKMKIDVSFTLTLVQGVDVEQVRERINQAIAEYFLSVRKEWTKHLDDYSYSTWIFQSQIITTVMALNGIANVQNVRLNGLNSDIQMQLDNTKQEMPVLGEVILV